MAHELSLTSPTTQKFLEEVEKRLPKDVVSMTTSMHYGDESKYVTAEFSTKKYPKGIELLHLTDVQYGHVCCNVPRYIEFRDWVLSEPNRFVLFGGDMVDAAHSLSVASPYENTVEPMAQVFRFVELTAPMRHRVLGYVGGNHERRSCKMFGDLGHLIATLLRVPYSSGKQFVDINYGSHQPFKISLWHGGSGSRTKGAKMQMLHRFMQQGESNLFAVGHLHDCMMTYDWRQIRKNGRIHLEKFAGVMSSSFLEHFGTYAEVSGMAPTDTVMWRTILESNGHWELTIR